MERDLVGIREIAALAHVTAAAVVHWRGRDSTFPAPEADLASGPVFNRDAIRKWLRTKRGRVTTTICVINLKGGVAKTTTTVATAQVLSGVHGKKVLIIDLDPQTNASIMLVGEDRWEKLNAAGHTVAQLFRDALEPKNRRFDISQAIQTKVGNVSDARTVSLLSSSLDLIAIQDKLASMPRGQYYSDSPIDVLRKSVKPVLGEYDVVLID